MLWMLNFRLFIASCDHIYRKEIQLHTYIYTIFKHAQIFAHDKNLSKNIYTKNMQHSKLKNNVNTYVN